MSKFLSIVVCVFALMVPAESVFAMTNAEAINKSGRQRMLSQRMMKNYLMIGSEVRPHIAQKQLDDAVALFEQQFLELRDYAPNKEINAGLDAVEAIWLVHRQKLLAFPDKKQVPELIIENDALLKACHKVVGMIQTYAGGEAAHQVNVSGRQRMLSQRIAKFYVSEYWKVPFSKNKQELNSAVEQFDTALKELMAYKNNTPEINTKLKKVQAQWEFSKAGFRQQHNGRYVPTVISVTTESILKKMNEITGLYEQLMLQLTASR